MINLIKSVNVDKFFLNLETGAVKVTLGRNGDYSVRAVLDLARHYGKGRRKNHEIAASMQIPRAYLSRILANLVRCGLLSALAGRDGGYELSRPPSRVRLLDVVEAAEGNIELQECLLRGIPCGKSPTCPVHEAWSEAQQAMVRRLHKTTFAEIVRRESAPTTPRSRR
jgi:Rrf2 family protein